ncbi:MAG: aminotransferase class I/II-fold pyridoxal phosphate-dependent enzyme [Planctomycetota bacterium]|nr:aminotransferase class I/II-fold pyridoxal phosphate-dependent enzyme [Planctomycetota bacterium]
MNERLRNLPTYPMVALEKTRKDLLERGVRVFDFGTGDPLEPTPAVIRQALLDGVPEVCRYPSIDGHATMRQAAADYFERRFGVRLDPDSQVLPTLGSKEAVFHLPMTFVQIPSEQDLVLYGEPAYPVFELGALFAEAWTYALPLGANNNYLMDPDAVPESVLRRAAIVYLNYPHNPTGQCLTDELFQAWVAARNRYGFTLVSDECYADLYYGESRPRSLLEFSTEGCLAVHSLSKRSGMTGYRSGFVAGDPELLATYRRFRAGMGVAPQDFVQSASTVAWSDEEHVEQRRKMFGDKRRVLIEHFESIGLRVYPSEAGLFLWVEVPPNISDVDYAARCAEQGILVAPGSYFGKGQERFFRVALVPALDDCRAATELDWSV